MDGCPRTLRDGRTIYKSPFLLPSGCSAHIFSTTHDHSNNNYSYSYSYNYNYKTINPTTTTTPTPTAPPTTTTTTLTPPTTTTTTLTTPITTITTTTNQHKYGCRSCSPITWMGVGFAGVGVAVGCNVGKCGRSTEGTPGATTVVITNGLHDWLDPDRAGYTIYSTNDTSSSFQSGDMAVLRADPSHSAEGLSLTHIFDADAIHQQPRRIYITNNEGAPPICVAGVGIVRPDGQAVTVSGNLGAHCGMVHYESSVEVLSPAADHQDAAPNCTWIDRYGSNGITLPGLAFDLYYNNASGEETEENSTLIVTSNQDLCKAPFLAAAAHPEDNTNAAHHPHPRQVDAEAEANTDYGTFTFTSLLVKSRLGSSSAVRMCGDPRAKGPDFVSIAENLYCDMDTRQLFPVCAEEDSEHPTKKVVCFDLERDELVDENENEIENDN
jgi:hypothetical protein